MKEKYASPQIEVIEVAIERGFMVSSVDVNPWGEGGSLGSYDIE